MPKAAYAARASKLMSDRLAADGFGGFDPSTLLPILLDLLAKLFKCQPTPQGGFGYLTWRPVSTPRWLDWLFGSPADRLYRYRQQVNETIARSWTRPGGREPFITALWSAVDAGDLTPDLMAGLYSEAKG